MLQYSVKDKFKMPPRPSGMGRPPKYPFGSLKIGQTAIVTPKNRREVTLMRASAFGYAGRHGWKIETRTLDNGDLAVKRLRA